MDQESKRKYFLKQAPILEKIPEKDQITVFNKATRSPVLWLIAVLMIFALFYFRFDLIMQWTENPVEASSTIRKGILIFQRIFIPILVPFMGILAVLVFIRNSLIKREVKKYLNENN